MSSQFSNKRQTKVVEKQKQAAEDLQMINGRWLDEENNSSIS